MIKRWLQKRRHGGGAPVPAGMFRLVVLNDNLYPDYIGWREWCSGQPYWEDRACRCSHTEEPPA